MPAFFLRPYSGQQREYNMSESQKLACKVAIITDVARGIGRATAILFQQPGAIVTALSQPIFEDPEFRAYWEKKAPVGRIGQPEDVAAAAALTSTAAQSSTSDRGDRRLRGCGGERTVFLALDQVQDK